MKWVREIPWFVSGGMTAALALCSFRYAFENAQGRFEFWFDLVLAAGLLLCAVRTLDSTVRKQ